MWLCADNETLWMNPASLVAPIWNRDLATNGKMGIYPLQIPVTPLDDSPREPGSQAELLGNELRPL
jgi:hypothetical protein